MLARGAVHPTEGSPEPTAGLHPSGCASRSAFGPWTAFGSFPFQGRFASPGKHPRDPGYGVMRRQVPEGSARAPTRATRRHLRLGPPSGLGPDLVRVRGWSRPENTSRDSYSKSAPQPARATAGRTKGRPGGGSMGWTARRPAVTLLEEARPQNASVLTPGRARPMPAEARNPAATKSVKRGSPQTCDRDPTRTAPTAPAIPAKR